MFFDIVFFFFFLLQVDLLRSFATNSEDPERSFVFLQVLPIAVHNITHRGMTSIGEILGHDE